MKFFLSLKIAFVSTKVKKAPASSGHTCWENASLSAPGESGQEEASPKQG